MLTTVESWLPGLLLYPGLLFAAAICLGGEWLCAVLRPTLVRRQLRAHAGRYHPLQPVYDVVKLLARQPSGGWPSRPNSSAIGTGVLALVGAVAPLLALLLMPLPGNPMLAKFNSLDLFTVVALLAVQPLAGVLTQMRGGGLAVLAGAARLGRLITGLLPSCLVIAALVEVAGTKSLRLVVLTAAPETAAQFLVRVIAGGVLLYALPMWSDAAPGGRSDGSGQYAGRLLQMVALASFWAVLVIPAPGEITWALPLVLVAVLAAYVAMRLISDRLPSIRGYGRAAGVVWSAAVPAGILALVIALVWGATA